MKKNAVYLVLVLLILGGCEYFSSTTDYMIDPYDESACYTVDDGLTSGKTLRANTDPYFLDDNNVNALIKESDEIQVIETKVEVVIAGGDLDVSDGDASETKYAFANIENYYDSVSTIELYMHKSKATVDSLLSGQSYDDVIFSDNFEADINATFDSVYTTGDIQDFVIEDQMSKLDFFIESTRCLYGENGSIPVFETNERSYRVTCAAVEVMSLYSYLDIEESDIVTFYFNEHMSMRIWDEEGNRIPMTDNSIDLEMAAQFSGRGDQSTGQVLSKCVYDLEEGRYLVRWIRGESTKFDGESPTNYFNFRVGIFPDNYEADPEIIDIAEKLKSPTVNKELRSAFQCDTSLWAEDEALTVTDLLRSADKMNALLDGLDSITVEDLDKGIHFAYDQDLPQGLFFLALEDMEDVDTLRIYSDGGSFTMFKRTAEYESGGKKFDPFSPNVTGVTFREMYVSPDIEDVRYFYNFDENFYLVSVQYDGEASGINLVVKGN